MQSDNGRKTHPRRGSAAARRDQNRPHQGTSPSRTHRGIRLRQVTEDDMPFLFRLFADPTRCHLWKQGRAVHDEREFHEAWIGWSSDMMGAKFLVEHRSRPIGLIFEYGRTLEDAHTKVTALLEAQSVGGGRGVIATALLCEWIFMNLPVRKVYMENYGYNARVAGMLRKVGLPEEGQLKENRFWNGEWWDLHIFALYRTAWPEVRKRILRPQRAHNAAGQSSGNGEDLVPAVTKE